MTSENTSYRDFIGPIASQCLVYFESEQNCGCECQQGTGTYSDYSACLLISVAAKMLKVYEP